MPTKPTITAFEGLLATYAYRQALLLVTDLPADAYLLLMTLVERRELNVAYLYRQVREMAELSERFDLPALAPTQEDEQLINYLYDLEAKVKTGQLIDFVRAVSPMIYRLYLRLLHQVIPDLDTYILNSKSDQYDRWRFDQMGKSSHTAIQAFISRRRDSRVTSSSLLDLLLETALPDQVKETAQLLRQFERSVRNPLAHLIKPFDEEELHRTTGFSSRLFLAKIISLARASGLPYDDNSFYFDRANAVLARAYHASQKELGNRDR